MLRPPKFVTGNHQNRMVTSVFVIIIENVEIALSDLVIFACDEEHLSLNKMTLQVSCMSEGPSERFYVRFFFLNDGVLHLFLLFKLGRLFLLLFVFVLILFIEKTHNRQPTKLPHEGFYRKLSKKCIYDIASVLSIALRR